MINRSYEFESAESALFAANHQLRAVGEDVNEILSLVYILADKLHANEDTAIYASALGCVGTLLETVYSYTQYEIVVSNEPTQADMSADNPADK